MNFSRSNFFLNKNSNFFLNNMIFKFHGQRRAIYQWSNILDFLRELAEKLFIFLDISFLSWKEHYSWQSIFNFNHLSWKHFDPLAEGGERGGRVRNGGGGTVIPPFKTRFRLPWIVLSSWKKKILNFLVFECFIKFL